jgi:aminopeptidase N
MLQTIRHVINDDAKWRNILRGLNKTFYHQTVTTQQVENYISKNSGVDLTRIFDQYLRKTTIPELQYYYSADKKQVFYRWDSCVSGFNMPLVLTYEGKSLRIYPTQKWKQLSDVSLFDPSWIDKNYYIRLKQVKRGHLLGVTP